MFAGQEWEACGGQHRKVKLHRPAVQRSTLPMCRQEVEMKGSLSGKFIFLKFGNVRMKTKLVLE